MLHFLMSQFLLLHLLILYYVKFPLFHVVNVALFTVALRFCCAILCYGIFMHYYLILHDFHVALLNVALCEVALMIFMLHYWMLHYLRLHSWFSCCTIECCTMWGCTHGFHVPLLNVALCEVALAIFMLHCVRLHSRFSYVTIECCTMWGCTHDFHVALLNFALCEVALFDSALILHYLMFQYLVLHCFNVWLFDNALVPVVLVIDARFNVTVF